MSKKNRNGKPTDFQRANLRVLGFSDWKSIKTYRDAENALKRLTRSRMRAGKEKAKQTHKTPQKPSKAANTKVLSGWLVTTLIVPVYKDAK